MKQELKELYELVERMSNISDNNGEYAVLRSWLNDFEVAENHYLHENNFYQIYGFIWGLCATNFISEEERENLTNTLIEYDS